MDKYSRGFDEDGPISIIDNIYKFQSCEYPRSIAIDSESIDYQRFNSNYTKRNKKVTFNNKVTIVNIQSHKKVVNNRKYKNFNSIIDEEFSEDTKKRCVNCIIF